MIGLMVSGICYIACTSGKTGMFRITLSISYFLPRIATRRYCVMTPYVNPLIVRAFVLPLVFDSLNYYAVVRYYTAVATAQ